ncbi:MAG: hypothetical protein C0418_02225 [Coriobacteriaceae bacterium]|nr:hypothetical protein [Coriobacteriaceae bacterium]
MSVPARFRALNTVVKVYFVGYSLASVALLVLALLGGLGVGPGVEPWTYWGGYALFVLALAGQAVAVATGMRADRVMIRALPVVVVGVGLLTAGLHKHMDLAFAIAVSVPIFYIATSHVRSAWSISALFAFAYLGGHLLSASMGMEHTAGDWLSIAIKAAAIIYLGVALALVTARQAERRQELLESGVQIEQLNYRLQRRLSELHAVSEITEIIHSTLDFDSVGPVVIDILQKVIDLPSCSLFVIDKTKAETLFSASKGVPNSELAALQSTSRVGRTGAVRPGETHYACTSVFDHNTMMVVFCAESEAIEAMGDEDRLVLSAVASELVVAVENSQLYKLTKRLAITDELTGLYNYRYLQQRLDEEIERSKRYTKSLSFIMLDVDDFKAYNDAHGHLAGDAALAELGQVLRKCVREVDVVARYGGEEFSVILPETDPSGAYVVAEKIRETVSAHAFAEASGARGVSMTVSVGLAAYPVHAHDKETLLRQADDALYNAKELGKDRVRSPHRKIEPPEGLPAGKEA